MAFDAKRSCLAALSVAAAAFVVCPAVFPTAGSVGNMIADASGKDSEDGTLSNVQREKDVQGAVNFKLVLDSYQPKKDHYNFYFPVERFKPPPFRR